MIVLIYLFNIISPIITIVGTVILLFGGGLLDPLMWVLCGVSAIIGLIFGGISWGYGVPPRWFWAKSKLDLFDNLVVSSLKCAYTFFLIPLCIMLLVGF